MVVRNGLLSKKCISDSACIDGGNVVATSSAEGESIGPVPDVVGDSRSIASIFVGGISRCVWYDSRGVLAE